MEELGFVKAKQLLIKLAKKPNDYENISTVEQLDEAISFEKEKFEKLKALKTETDKTLEEMSKSWEEIEKRNQYFELMATILVKKYALPKPDFNNKKWKSEFVITLDEFGKKYETYAFGVIFAKRTLTIGATVILILGCILNYYYGNNFLERFGALLVAFSLIYMFYHINILIPSITKYLNEKRDTDISFEERSLFGDDFFVKVKKLQENNQDDIKIKSIITLLKVELLFVVLGTFVNGFGSVLVSIMS